MFMKRLGVAAVLIVCAFGASASNFRGADQVYVPIAGHAEGATGVFITDAWISNLSGDDVDVSVIFQPRVSNVGFTGTPGEDIRGKITLRGNERKEFPDIFVNTFGKPADVAVVGQLIFSGCKKDTSCGPDTQDADGFSENFRAISVETRIYQVPKGAGTAPHTTGQLLSGIPWYNYVSSDQSNVNLDRIFITGFTHNGNPGQDGTYRSNIGLVNASQWNNTHIIVRLYKGTLADADRIAERDIELGPLGNVQFGFSDLFGSTIFPAQFGSNFFVTVEQRQNSATPSAPLSCNLGCPAFLAYGSVLDNGSGDATTLESQYMKELDPAALLVIYPSSSGKAAIRRVARH